MLNKVDFKQLFDTYFDEIRRFVFYRCGDEDTASDIAQDVFLKIWEKRDRLICEKMKPLLYKMANEKIIDNYRREVCQNGFQQSLKIDAESEISPEEKMVSDEFIASYAEALVQIPEKQRLVFLMNREDDLKYKEIAECLQISVKTVEKRMSAALQLLKTKLL
jgi:RNA polymerase sigma-70 factor (ECF subfamily)